jgi:RES domain-containing protein
VTDALYFADSPETAWSEFYRHLAEAAVPPDQAMPRDLWSWRVSVGEVVDLRTAERLAAVGLEAPEPGFRNWPTFQRVGERLHAEGHKGLIAPSAAHEDGLVLCLFKGEDDFLGARPAPPARRLERPPLIPIGLRT